MKRGLDYTSNMRINKKKCKNCLDCKVDKICQAAAVRTGKDGYPEIDDKECNECLRCVGSCPFNALEKGKERL